MSMVVVLLLLQAMIGAKWIMNVMIVQKSSACMMQWRPEVQDTVTAVYHGYIAVVLLLQMSTWWLISADLMSAVMMEGDVMFLQKGLSTYSPT